MNSGDLRHRIIIQEKISSRDTYGMEKITWSHVSEVWASAEPLRGQEYLEARRLQADIDVRFRMRYRDGIKPAMRVLHDGRIFDIQGVIHVKEAGRELQLMCKEHLKEGI